MKKAVSVAFAVGVMTMTGVGAANYSDELIETDDASVRRGVNGSSIVYVFTNAAADSISVTFKQPCQLSQYLVVGGGGAGGWTLGGGGGGGGVIESSAGFSENLEGEVSLKVGKGGDPQAGATSTTWPRGLAGGASELRIGTTVVTAYGGAGGSGWNQKDQVSGTYGSGGGSACASSVVKPSGTTYQGFAGGTSSGSNNNAGGGGGGGATGSGGNGTSNGAGVGGAGYSSSITGVATDYGAGGGGGCGNGVPTAGAAGGTSAGAGGGKGGNVGSAGQSAPDGFGGGGGGGGYNPGYPGGAGGVGTVVLRVVPMSGGFLWVRNGSGSEIGSVSPAYGTYLMQDGQSQACTAVAQTDPKTKLSAICTGYTLETWDATAEAWGEPIACEGTSYAYTQAGEARVRLTWQWSVEPSVDWVAVAEDGKAALKVNNTAATTLAAWLAATGVDDLSVFDEIWFAGTADVTATTELNAWKKIVRVKAGARVIAANSNALGTTAESVTYVEAGGQVVIHHETKNGTMLRNKATYIEGAGPDGTGALYSTCVTDSKSVWPQNIILSGDARISWKNGNQDIYPATFDLNGHDLNILSRNNSYDRIGNGTVINDTSAAQNGRVIIDNSVLFEGSNTFTPTGNHELIFRTNGIYRTNGGQGYSATGDWTNHWKMVIAGPTSGGTATGFNVGIGRNGWRAPVELNYQAKIDRQNCYSSQTFFGPVSGQCGFGVSACNSMIWLRLANAANTFKGGIRIKDGSYLTPSVNGAVPAFADSGAVTLENGCTVWLKDGVTYTLPDLKMTGTGTTYRGLVHGGAGAWKTVVKSDSTDMIWRSGVGAQVLDLQKGVFRIPSPLAGLYEGFSGSDNVTSSRATATNDVQMLPLAMKFEGNVSYRAERGTAGYYTGYIWNRGTSDVTWGFAVSETGNFRMYIDDQAVLAPTQSATPTFATYTLTPGAHAFEIRYSGNTTQGTKVNNAYPWGDQYKGWGIDVNNKGRTNTADYVILEDTGVGSVFTLAKTLAELPEACRQTMPVFETLVATNVAAQLDLCGNSLMVPVVVGAPQVVNGSPDLAAGTLTVGTAWTVATKATVVDGKTKQLPVGTAQIAGAIAFATDAKVRVPDNLAHGTYTLATASSITGLPKSANEKWYTQIVDNGDGTQSLKLVYGVGLRVFVR